MSRKPKTNQPQTPNEAQGRDFFQTPNYAVDLLVPYIPTNVRRIWECAAGKRKITDRLIYCGYDTYSTDLQDDVPANFLTWDLQDQYTWCDAIITNPPFSLKRKFWNRCREYNVPFALLIPADYSGWIIKAIQDGAEKIIPTRRIDYITPTGLSGATGHTSYYHSMWLTWGFSLGKSETFVELTKEMKENI
jgi:hypothetical protein